MYKNLLFLCSFFVFCGCKVQTTIDPIGPELLINWYLTVCQKSTIQSHTFSNRKDKPFSVEKMSFLYKTEQLSLEPNWSRPGTWFYSDEKTCYKENISSISNPRNRDSSYSGNLPLFGVVVLRLKRDNSVEEKKLALTLQEGLEANKPIFLETVWLE